METDHRQAKGEFLGWWQVPRLDCGAGHTTLNVLKEITDLYA